MTTPQKQASGIERVQPGHEQDLGLCDAGNIIDFDNAAIAKKAEEQWNAGEALLLKQKEYIGELKPVDFDKEPGLQLRELDEFALNIGLLMNAALEKNPELSPITFLGELNPVKITDETLKTSAENLKMAFAGHCHPKLGEFIRKNFVGLFHTVKKARKLIDDGKDDPNFLGNLINKGKDSFENVSESIQEKGFWNTAGEFYRENKGKILAGAMLVGGILLLKSLFGGDEEESSSDKKKKGWLGGLFSKMGWGGGALLGAGLVASLFAGDSQGIIGWIKEQFSNTKGKIMKETFTRAIAPFIGKEKAQQLWDKANNTSENGEGGVIETVTNMTTEEVKKWWEETKKPDLLKWLIAQGISKEMAEKALNTIDILELQKALEAGSIGGVLKKGALYAGGAILAVPVALYLFKKIVGSLLWNIPKWIFFLFRRHPLAMLGAGLAASLGLQSSQAKEIIGEQADEIFGNNEARKLTEKEKEFLALPASRIGVEESFLEDFSGLRLVDFMNMGSGLLGQIGGILPLIDLSENWDSDFAKVYDFFMQEEHQEEIDDILNGAKGRNITVLHALAKIYGDTDLQKEIQQRDDEAPLPSLVETTKESLEWSLHRTTQQLIDVFSPEAKQRLTTWDQENPGMRGTTLRLAHVLTILSTSGHEVLIDGGKLLITKGAHSLFVVPLMIPVETVKNILTGQWEEIMPDAVEGAVTTVGAGAAIGMLRFKPGKGAMYGAKKLMLPLDLIWALRHYERIIPRTGMLLDQEFISKVRSLKTKVANTPGLRRLFLEKATLEEHEHILKRLEDLRAERDWLLNHRWRTIGNKRFDAINTKKNALFKKLRDFEGGATADYIPREKLKGDGLVTWWNESVDAPIEGKQGISKASVKSTHKTRRPDLPEGTAKRVPKFIDIDELSEAKYIQHLQKQAVMLAEAEKGVHLRVQREMDTIADMIEGGMSPKDPAIKLIQKKINRELLEPLGRQKLENFKALNAAYKKVPKASRTPDLKKAIRKAMWGEKGTAWVRFKQSAKGRAKGMLVMAAAMVAVDTIVGKENPDEELTSTLSRLGPDLKQLLLDSFPLAGTYSNLYSAVTGDELMTENDVSGGWQRTSNLLFGVGNAALDVATIVSFGAGIPIITATRVGVNALKFGKRGTKMAKTLQAIIPKLSKIAGQMKGGWKEVLEKSAVLLRGGKLESISQKATYAALGTTAIGIGSSFIQKDVGEIDMSNVDPDLKMQSQE